MNLLCLNFDWTIGVTDILTVLLPIVASVLIVVIGWKRERNKDREQAALEQRLNRENEIAKERRNYKMDMYISTSGFIIMLRRKIIEQDIEYLESSECLNTAQEITGKISLFGTDEELKCWENIGVAITDRDKDKFDQNFSEWEEFIKNGIKKELVTE